MRTLKTAQNDAELNVGALSLYFPNSDSPNDAHVYDYINSGIPANRLCDSAQKAAFLQECARARYLMVECPEAEIPKKFRQYLGAQGNREIPFFELNEKNRICEYDVRSGVYVELSPIKEVDHPIKEVDHPKNLDPIDRKDSSGWVPKSPDSGSSGRGSPDLRNPEEGEANSSPPGHKKVILKSGCNFFPARKKLSSEAVAPAHPPLSFAEQKKIIYYALKYSLYNVLSTVYVETLLDHISEAQNLAAIRIRLECFFNWHNLDSRTNKVLLELQSESPDFESMRAEAEEGIKLVPGVHEFPQQFNSPRHTYERETTAMPLRPIQQNPSLLIQAVMWFLERIVEFLARIQCAPISPFCAHRFAC